MKVFCLTVLLLVSVGCMSGYRDERGRWLPKSPHWSFADPSLERSGIIEYGFVYVGEVPNYHPSHRFQLMRFWRGGRFAIKWSETDDPSQLDSSDNAGVGYFFTSKKNVFTENYATTNFGQYGYGIYEVLPDGSLLKISSAPSKRGLKDRDPLDDLSKYTILYPVYEGKDFEPDW